MAAGGGGVIEAVLLVSAVVPVSVVVCLLLCVCVLCLLENWEGAVFLV